MQAVAGRGNSEELHKIVRDATDAFERSKNISTIGNPVVDALLNQCLHTAEENGIKVTLDVTIPEVLSISPLSLSILIGNTFDNAIEACCACRQNSERSICSCANSIEAFSTALTIHTVISRAAFGLAATMDMG